MVMAAFNPTTQEAEAVNLLSSRLSTWQVPGLPGYMEETLPLKKKKKDGGGVEVVAKI